MYNVNAGYGAGIATSLASIAGNVGKIFVVAKSAAAAADVLKQIYVPDPDGKMRYFATLNSAIEQCVANRGDTIIVAPGHTETISSATALSFNKAGITIKGLGYGNNGPTFTFDTAATSTIPVSADGITVQNLIFSANFADITALFTLAAAKHFRLDGCYVKATAVNMNFLSVIKTNATSNAADGLQVVGCKWIEPDTATLQLVTQAGDNADILIANNFVQLGVKNNTPALLSVADGKDVQNLQMFNNYVVRLNTDTATGAILFHTDQSDNTGIVAGNFAQHADIAAELLITASSGLSVFENYASGVAGASGYILPAVDS